MGSGNNILYINISGNEISGEIDKNGNIVSGNKDSYTDITEFWTFTQEVQGADWKVSGVETPA